MDIDGTEWISLREAEQIIGRSRRQIWRYIYDGSWDTRAVMDNLNRPVTYVRAADILRKKAEIESTPDLNAASIIEKQLSGGMARDEETNLTIVHQLLERLIAGQGYQNNLIKKCLYILVAILIGTIAAGACYILNLISD